MRSLTVQLPEAGATAGLGAALAGAITELSGGCATVHFRGELAAGKTTCVRGLLRALGVNGPIRSPTYTLIEAYATPRLTCVHVDLYRLRGAAEVDDLGLQDYMSAGHLILIEWPERGGASVPAADLDVALGDAGAGRRAELRGPTTLGATWIEKLAQDSRIISYLPNLT